MAERLKLEPGQLILFREGVGIKILRVDHIRIGRVKGAEWSVTLKRWTQGFRSIPNERVIGALPRDTEPSWATNRLASLADQLTGRQRAAKAAFLRDVRSLTAPVVAGD